MNREGTLRLEPRAETCLREVAVVKPLPDQSLYVTSADEIAWGGILIALTLIIHGFGMLLTIEFSGFYKSRFEKHPNFITGIIGLILASWIITSVHITEVMLWAGFFQWKDCFSNFSTATYFAFTEYTTLGSNFDLPENWRLLEGMIATSGLIGFAWSTGVLMTLAQGFQKQQLQRINKRYRLLRSTSVSETTESGA
jgi:hypothetical protein